jgi:hypothetical protein
MAVHGKVGCMNRGVARTIHVLSIVAFASSAGAQSRATASSPFDVWVGVGAAPTGSSGVLTSSYSPPLLFDGAFTSAAAQTITFDIDSAAGLTGGANLWLNERAGVQILGDRVPHSLTASTSTPYMFSLQYASRLPPNDEVQIVDVHQTVPWPAVTGCFRDLNASVNAVVRAGHANRVSATASGGLTIHRVTGTLQPLAFTSFHLGGHSVLLQDDYRLMMALGPTISLGVNVGGDVNIALGSHAALMVGYRYMGGSSPQIAVQPRDVVNADQVVFEQPLTDIAARLGATPVTVSLSHSRIMVGLKVMR